MDLEEAGEQYRAAKHAVIEHRRVQAAAELAHNREPTPENHAAMLAAVEDVKWCQALVVACGEAVKGVPFSEVPNNRAPVDAARDRVLGAG